MSFLTKFSSRRIDGKLQSIRGRGIEGGTLEGGRAAFLLRKEIPGAVPGMITVTVVPTANHICD